jgi:hypothetical protein
VLFVCAGPISCQEERGGPGTMSVGQCREAHRVGADAVLAGGAHVGHGALWAVSTSQLSQGQEGQGQGRSS